MHLHISLEILFEIASWLLFIVSQVSYISSYVLRTVTEQYSYTGIQIRYSSYFGKELYTSGTSHRCLQISVHCCLVIRHSPQEARDNEASNTRAIIYFFISYLLRIITHSPHCQVVHDCDRHCRSFISGRIVIYKL